MTSSAVHSGTLASLADVVDDRSPRGIAAAVNRLIRSGDLSPGDRLPTVRALARELGVSPATVNEAWRALASVGAVQSRGRAGTFVLERPAAGDPRSERPSRYLGIGGDPDGQGLNLSAGTPDPALLPRLDLALERVAARGGALTTSYLDDPVLPELEEVLRAGWPYPPERMTVVDGALDALSRLIDLRVHLGDRVAMENPGFPPLIDLLERVGAEVVGMAMDHEGVIPAELERAVTSGCALVFLQPRAQNPTGVSMSLGRAAELAAILAPHDVMVIEDDHSGDIATGPDVSLGRHLPDRVVHLRSYSKSHGPDLRIAAVGGPARVIDPLVARRMLGPGWTSRLLQAALVELLTDPASIAAVRRARSAYASRSLAVRAGLAGRGVPSTPGDGINAWVDVVDERAALLSLAAQGIRVSPGTPFLLPGAVGHHIRVTTGVIDEHDGSQIAFVIDALAAAAIAGGMRRGV